MPPEPMAVRGAKRLGQCCAEIRPDKDRDDIWFCTKPEGHTGQHEATIKWGRADA